MTHSERLTSDELNQIIKRVNSSRSIQWWKDDIKRLIHEVKALRDKQVARLFDTSDKSPPVRKPLLYWHPLTASWRLGIFWNGPGGGHFQGDGAWYLSDGHTKWCELPPEQDVRR